SARVLHHLHSFPTRRSSDLAAINAAVSYNGALCQNPPLEERRGCMPEEISPPVKTTVSGSAAARGLKTGPPIDQSSVTLHAFERSEEHTSELQSPDHLVCRL